MQAKDKIFSLSLVVPAFNEEEIISETIHIYSERLKKLTKNHEIIIVNDGSIDKTPEILKRLKKKYKIKIVTHEKNLGVGRTILSGFKVAKCKWVMHNSADRPFDLKDLKKASKLFEKSDVIVVARKDRSANPFFRKLTSLTSFWLVKIFFGVPIKDFHFVQIYKRSILNKVQVRANDTFAPAELLIKLYKGGYKISCFTAIFHKRTAGQSKYNNPVRYLRYLKDLAFFWLSLRQQPR